MVCVLLAGYMTLKETIRYLDNLDASTITFKEFARNTEDSYPTFSICITDDQKISTSNVGLMYSYFKTDIKNTLPDSIINDNKDYSNVLPRVLQGEEIPILDKSLEFTGEHYDIRNVSIGHFNSLTVDLKELVNVVEFIVDDPNESIEIDAIENSTSAARLPFHVSYQDPETICYTRDNEEKTGIVRVSDTFSLRKDKLRKFHNQTVFNF